ncbi:MFS transporter [Paenibacillus sp. Z6-24]
MSATIHHSRQLQDRKNRYKFNFVCLWLLIFLVEFVKGGLLVTLLPLYMGHRLGLPAFAIGLAFALQYVGDNALRSPAGWLAERLGFRMTMTLGMILVLISVFIMATVQQTGWLIAACAIMGIGSAPLWPCVMSKITDLSSGNGNYGTPMSIIEIASLGGAGLGPVIVNWLSSRDSYHFTFDMLLLCMGAVIIVALCLPGRGRKQELSGAAHAPEQHGIDEGRSDELQMVKTNNRAADAGMNRIRYYARLIRSLHIHPLLYPALFMQSFALGILTPIITLYVVRELGLTPAYFNALLIGGGVVTVLGLIPAGRLIDRLGSRLFLRTGFLLEATALIGLASTHMLFWIWVFVLCAGFSYAMILPAWNALLANLVPSEEKAAVWGLFLTLQGSGLVIGPLVSGRLWDAVSPQAPFFVSAAAMLSLFIIHWLMTRDRPDLK